MLNVRHWVKLGGVRHINFSPSASVTSNAPDSTTGWYWLETGVENGSEIGVGNGSETGASPDGQFMELVHPGEQASQNKLFDK